jgi:hypothetical protein
VCGVFLLDAHFMVDGATFVSGSMAALSVMINLEIPHVNVLSKMDLLGPSARRQLDAFLVPDMRELGALDSLATANKKLASLTQALGQVLEDYSLIKYFPLDITDEDNVSDLLVTIDNTIQYGEDLDVREPPEVEQAEDDAGEEQ